MLKDNVFKLLAGFTVLTIASIAKAENDDRFPPQAPTTQPIKNSAVQPMMSGKQVWAMFNPPPRGEFEEKADYEKRVSTNDLSGIIYVDVTPPKYGSVRYDIDRRVMMIGFLAPPPNMIKTLGGRSIDLENNIEMKTGVGQNGFGATRGIITMSGDEYEAYVPNLTDLMKLGPNPNYSIPAVAGRDFAFLEFPLDVSTAKTVKPSLRIIVGLKLMGKDKTETSEFNNAATETNRIQSNTKTYAVGAKLLKVIAFDTASDRIVFSKEVQR